MVEALVEEEQEDSDPVVVHDTTTKVNFREDRATEMYLSTLLKALGPNALIKDVLGRGQCLCLAVAKVCSSA
jgi:hypothetical protein